VPIRTEGLDEHEDELEDQKDRAQDLTPMTLKGAIVITTNFWPRRWRKQVDLLGRPWAALQPETIRNKKSARILFDRGRMFKSVQINRSPITKATEDTIIIGSADIRAATHQFGDRGTQSVPAHTRKVRPKGLTKKGRKKRKRKVEVMAHDRVQNIPPRPWIGWDRKDLDFLDKKLLDYILKGKA